MILLFIIFSFFLFLFIFIIGTYLFFADKRSIIKKRLEKLLTEDEKKKKQKDERFRILKTFESLGRALPLPEKELSKYQKDIVEAGFQKKAVWVFLGSKIFFSLALPLAYVILLVSPKANIYSLNSLIVVAMLAITGYLLPSYWLRWKIKKRKREIFFSLPDVLDLMTVCVDAGLSMDAALVRVSEDPQFYKNPLGKELRLVCNQIRAGISRSEALRRMGERTGVDDVKSFATMLIQTDKFGTSLSQALRVHSDMLRLIRSQQAMEEAAKAPTKILFPLVFLIFPALIIVILGPAFIIYIPMILETFK